MKAVITLISAVLAGAVLLIGLPYLLPLAGPFLIAFAVAAAIEPAVGSLCKRGVPRGLAAGVVTVLLLLLLGILLSLTVSNSMAALASLAKRAPEFLEALSAALTDLQTRLISIVRKAPDSVVEQLTIALEAVAGELYAVPAFLSEKLLSRPAWQNVPQTCCCSRPPPPSGSISFPRPTGTSWTSSSGSFPRNCAKKPATPGRDCAAPAAATSRSKSCW